MSERSSTDSVWRWWVPTTVMVTVLVAAMVRPGVRTDWFFDEAWRVDMIRSAGFDRYFDHNTPTSPGWILIHKLLFSVVPPTREVMRVVAALPAIVAWVGMAALLRRFLSQTLSRSGAELVAFGTVLLVLLQPGDSQLITYFNNYSFETLFTVGVLWVAALPDRRYSVWALAGMCAIGPFVVQAPLMLLAPVVVWMWWRGSGTERRVLVAGAISGAVIAVFTYVVFLRPVASREISGLSSITGFWEGESFAAAGVIGGAKLWLRTLMFSVVPTSWHWSVQGWLFLGAGVVLGLVVMWRLWRLWVVMIPITQLVILTASVAVGWPMSFTRVNHAVGLLITVLVPLGLVFGLWWVVSQWSSLAAVPATAVGVVVLAVLVWPSEVRSSASNTAVFARGLSDDMDDLVPRLSEGDVVLGFHSMSSWYLNDRLVTASPTSVVVLDELEFGERLTTNPVSLVDELAPASRTVWCVLPWEVGDAMSERCGLTGPEWTLTETTSARRAEIRRWDRVTD